MSKPVERFVCLDVLNLLMEKPRTAEQLFTMLSAHPDTIRYALKSLEEAGLAKVDGTADRSRSATGQFPYLWKSRVEKK